jgi:hypothetical protein
MAAVLTKLAVRVKFDGSLAVMHPSDGLIRIFNDRIYGEYTPEEIKALPPKQVENVHSLKMDRNYTIFDETTK